MTEEAADIIDLAAAADACRPLIAWWRRREATGRDDPDGLDTALRQLDTCPPLDGPLGRAIATFDRPILASQPRPVLVAALTQLARLADVHERPTQLVLPGLDLPAPADTSQLKANHAEAGPGPGSA